MGKNQSVWDPRKANKQESLSKKTNSPASRGIGSPLKALGATTRVEAAPTPQHVTQRLFSPSSITLETKTVTNPEKNEKSSEPEPKRTDSPQKHYGKKFPQPSPLLVTISSNLSSDSEIDVEVILSDDEKTVMQVLEPKELSKPKGPLRASNADMEIIVSGQMAALANKRSQLPVGRRRRSSTQSAKRGGLSPLKRKKNPRMISKADLDVVTHATRMPPSGKEHRSAALRKKLAAVKLQQKASRRCKKPLKRLITDKKRKKAGNSSVDSLFNTAVTVTKNTVTERASKNTSENMRTVFSAIRMPIVRLTRVQTCPDGTVKLATCSAAQDQPGASLTTNLGPETLTEPFKPPNNTLELKVDESEGISNDVEDNEEPRDLETDVKIDEKKEQNLEEEHDVLDAKVKKIVNDEDSDVDVEAMDESFDINDMVTLDEIEEEDTLAENSDLLANECTKDSEAHTGKEKQSLVAITEKEVVEAQTHEDLPLKPCMNASKRPCYCCSFPAAKMGKGCIPVAMVSPMVKAPFQPDVPAVTVAPLFAEISLTKSNDECEGAASPMDDNSSQNSENFVLNLNLNSNDFETSVTSVESEPEIATPDPPTQGSSKTSQKLVSSSERRKTARDDASVDTASNMSKAQARLAELEDWDLEVAKKPPNPVDIEQDVIDDVTILSFTSQEDLLTFPPNATIAANSLQPLKDLVLRKTNDIKQVKGWRRKLAKFNFVPSSNSEEATASQDDTLALSQPQPPDAFLKPQTARRSKKFMLEPRVMDAEYVKFAMQALKLPELAVKVHKLELQEDSVNVNSVIVPVCCSPSPLPENPRGGARRRGKSASKAAPPVATPSVASSEPAMRRRRKRRTDQGPAPTKKVRLELGRLGVQYVEVEQVEVVGVEDSKKSEKTKEGECQEEFCKLGCVCDSLRTSHVVQHCGRADCMFECVCPPDRITRISQASTHKTLLTDAYLNQIEDEGKRNLSKNEKEFFQTVVKKGAEMVVVGEKKQRERRMPNRFRDSVFLVGAEFISSELDSNAKAGTSTEGADKRANKFYSSEYSMKSLKDMSGKSPPKSVSANKASRRAQQASEQATQNLISQKIHKVMQERKLMFKDLVAQEELREGNELDLSIRNQEMIQVIRWVRLQRLLAEEQVSIRYLKRRLHSSIIVSKPQDAVATDITIDVRELKGQEDAPGLVNILFSESMSPSSYAILFCDGVKWELAANLEGQSRKKVAATPAPSTSVAKLSDSVPAEAAPTCTQPSSSVSTNKASSTPSSVSNSSSSLPNPPNCFSVPLSLPPSPVVSSAPSISSSASTEVANTRPAKFSVPIPINKIPRPLSEKSILHSNGPTPRRTYRRYTYVPYKKPENIAQPPEAEKPATQPSPRPPSPAPETSKHLVEAKRQLQLALERESLYFPKPLYAALQIGTLPGTSKKHCRMKLILPVTDRVFSQSNSDAEARVTCLLPMVSQEDRWCIVALKGVANAGLQMPGTNCPIPRKLMHEAAMVARQKRVRVTLPIKLQKNEPAAEFMLEHFGIYAFPGISEHVFLGPFSTEFLASMAELPRAVRLVPCISSQKTKGKETLAVVRNVLDDLITRVCEAVAAKPTSNAVGGAQEAGPNEKMTSLKVKEFALAQRLAELNKFTKTPSLTDVLKTTRVKMVVRGYGANGTTPVGQKAVDKNQSAGAAGPKAKPLVEAPPKTTFVHVDLQSGLKQKIELELNVNGTVTARHPLNPEMRLGFTNVESAKEWFVKYDLDKPRLLKRGARALAAPPVVLEEEEREEIVVECTPMAMEREDEEDEDEEEDMLDDSEDSNDSEAVKENIGNLASVLAEDYVDVETVSDCEGRLGDLHGPSTSSGIRPGMEQKNPKSRRVVRSMSERARRKQLTILQRNLHTVLNGSDQEGEKTSKVYLMNKAKRTIDVLRLRESELNRQEETLRSLKQTYLKKLRELCEDLGPETRAVADIVMASCAAFETRRVDMLMAVESSYNRQHTLLKPQTNPAPEPKRPAQAKKITKKAFGPCSPPRVEESAPLKRPPRKAYLATRLKTAAPGPQRRAVRGGRGRGRRSARSVDSDRKDHNYGRPSDETTHRSSQQPCTTFTIQSPDDDSQELRVVRKSAPPSADGAEEPEFLPMIASVQSLAGSSFSFDMDETEEMEDSGGIELETASVSQDENPINRESVVHLTEIDEEAMEDESNPSDSESPKSFIKVSDFAKIVAKHVDTADTKKITVYRTAKAPADTATSTTPVFKTPVVIARQGGTGNLQVKSVGGANTVQRLPVQKRNLLPISATSTPVKGENPSSSCVKAVLMSVTSFGEHKTAVCKPITSGAGGKRPGVVEFIKVPTRTLVPGQISQLRSTSAPSIISGAKVANVSRTSPGTSSPPVMSYVVPFNPGVATKVSVTSAPMAGGGVTGVAKTVIPVSGASVYVLPQSTTAGKPVQLTSVYSGSELQRILQSSSGKQIMVFRSKNGKLIPTSTVTTVKSTSNAETAKDLTS